MRLLAIPVLLLAAAQESGEKDFAFRMARGKDLAARAVAAGDAAMAREAYDLYVGAARLRPKDPVPLAEAGLLALDFGDQAAAGEMLRALEALDPASAPRHYLRGCLLQSRSEFLDAREEFAAVKEGEYRAPAAKHRLFQCSVGLGLQYGVAGLHELAIRTLAAAVAMEPDDPLVPVACFNMGVSHRRLQAPKEAEKVLRLSMERFPRYAPSYGELGELLTELNRFDDAVQVLEQAVKADPSYARGWLLKAAAQYTRGKFKEAGEAFAEHDRLFKPSGLSEYFRGMYLQKKGEPARALEALRLSLALDATMVRSVYWIGICHRDLGEEKEAAAAMERWKKVEEENQRRVDGEMDRALRKVRRDPVPAEGGKDAGGG